MSPLGNAIAFQKKIDVRISKILTSNNESHIKVAQSPSPHDLFLTREKKSLNQTEFTDNRDHN